MSAKFIDYNGVKIFYTDLSKKAIGDNIQIMIEAKNLLSTQPEKSARVLINVEGMRYSKEYLDKMKEIGKANEPYVKATAIVGLTAVTKLIAKGVAQFTGRKSGFFDNENDALKWLVEQQ